MNNHRSGSRLASWSLRHPVGVAMMALAVAALGVSSMLQLKVDLLPHLIYPEIRIRVLEPGVPARVMEDRITRQLEEQLAITEDAVSVQSVTSEGRSALNLDFPYGKDIDIALRDASTRLDRAKRFLPATIDPPVIYKRDPSQIAVAEFVVASPLRDPAELRGWVDYVFGKWLLNAPGVAATEPGGGLVREIRVEPDFRRLGALGLDLTDLEAALRSGNVDTPAGRLYAQGREIGGRTAGRFESVDQIRQLPIKTLGEDDQARIIRLGDVAEVIDGHEDERLRVRANGVPGVKLSIQKQPQANTVSVVDGVKERLRVLEEQGLIPGDIRIDLISDQSTYVRRALHNAAQAAGLGALLAMLTVYLFLGDLRRTLIIGSAIPLAILVTFVLMGAGGLTLNIMTLGGLALGIGLLVDNTVVMLENIQRRQRNEGGHPDAIDRAAGEVSGAVFAATSTNLAAVLPFLFISGLIGLLFRELLFTISAAIAASLVVALTLVPALAARVHGQNTGRLRRGIDRCMDGLGRGYAAVMRGLLKFSLPIVLLAFAGAWYASHQLLERQQIFLPTLDEGDVSVRIQADPGIALDHMDAATQKLETLLLAQAEVETVFTIVGGNIFGRSQYQAGNRTSMKVRLVPRDRRDLSTDAWIQRMRKDIHGLGLVGFEVRMRNTGVRGVRLSRGDDDLSLRIQGHDLDTLADLGDQVVAHLRTIEGIRSPGHSLEETIQELNVKVDRDRLAEHGLSVADIGRALRIALNGVIVGDYMEGDRGHDIRLRLAAADMGDPGAVSGLLLRVKPGAPPLYLGDVADTEILAAPATIQRDQQQRIVEISAGLEPDMDLAALRRQIDQALLGLPLPDGYALYDGGATRALRENRDLAALLLGLALFLVFVVLAVQYESLRNPVIIMLSAPTAVIGVWIGLDLSGLPLSMPVWLGMIMLAGIVVNNAIVLVAFIEQRRDQGLQPVAAIIDAARLRLRPILMTTLTTVAGLLPLALALGEGAEMLQPLAVTIVAGLSFSTLVSLVMAPCLYRLLACPS